MVIELKSYQLAINRTYRLVQWIFALVYWTDFITPCVVKAAVVPTSLGGTNTVAVFSVHGLEITKQELTGAQRETPDVQAILHPKLPPGSVSIWTDETYKIHVSRYVLRPCQTNTLVPKELWSGLIPTYDPGPLTGDFDKDPLFLDVLYDAEADKAIVVYSRDKIVSVVVSEPVRGGEGARTNLETALTDVTDMGEWASLRPTIARIEGTLALAPLRVIVEMTDGSGKPSKTVKFLRRDDKWERDAPRPPRIDIPSLPYKMETNGGHVSRAIWMGSGTNRLPPGNGWILPTNWLTISSSTNALSDKP